MPAVPPAASNANVCSALQIQSELDQNVFQEICNRLLIYDDGSSTIPTNVVAAVLTITVKGLASPDVHYLSPKALSRSRNNVLSMGGLRGLALNYVRFQSQFGPDSSTLVVTLVEVATQCSILVKKWYQGEEPTILGSLYHYFLENASSIGETETSKNPSSSEVKSFAKLLSNTLDGICLTTTQCLEDLMDFDFLWAATLHDPGTNIPSFETDGASKSTYRETTGVQQQTRPSPRDIAESQSLKQYQCPKCLKEFNFTFSKTAAASFSRHVNACGPEDQLKEEMKKKRKSAYSLVTSQSIRRVAKDLAWTFSRMEYLTSSNPKGNSKGFDRGGRIMNAVACIDIVAAAMMAPIMSAPAKKRRRLESGDVNPQISVEDESTAALSPMLHNYSISLKDIREQSKQSLSQATSDLLSAVTDGQILIQHRDIVVIAQKIASSVLPFLTSNCVGYSEKSSLPSSPASHLLSFIGSHQLRERNLRILKESHHRALSRKLRVALSNTPLGISKERKPLVMGGIIGRFQRKIFIDTVNEFSCLNLTQRKILAPFDSLHQVSSHQEKQNLTIKAIIHTPNTSSRGLTQGQPTRYAIQISRVKNSPTPKAELKDLNEWITAMYLHASASTVKPSNWLTNHLKLKSSTTSTPDEGGDWSGWKTNTLPVLNNILEIADKECSIGARTCVISDTGECKVQQDDADTGVALQIYYAALEAIIRSPPGAMVFFDEELHGSLFSLCYLCVRKANNPEGRCFLIEAIGNCTLRFYRLVETFIKVMKPGSQSLTARALPSYIIQILCQLKEMLLGMVWMTHYNCLDKVENTFIRVITILMENKAKWRKIFSIKPVEEQSKSEKSGDKMSVVHMLRNLIEAIQHRVSNLCQLLSLPSASDTANKTMKVFKTMLRRETEIFFDRHPDQMMLCSLYTAMQLKSQFKPKITFNTIIKAYMEMNRDHLSSEILFAIVHRIKNCPGHDDQFGDIISLFNEVFVPKVKPYWQHFNGQKEPDNEKSILVEKP